MKTYEFAYGHGHVSVPLNEADILAELHGSETPPIADIRSALISSLEAPIDSKPLKNLALPDLKVALVVSDMTRFWMRQDLVVPHLGLSAGGLRRQALRSDYRDCQRHPHRWKRAGAADAGDRRGL